MSNSPILHVVGAGLAGLAAAVHGLRLGRRVVVHEAAGHAGGRCRSYLDRELGRTIDNGSHLLLHAYVETRALLAVAGAPVGSGGAALTAAAATAVEFVEPAKALRWVIRPNDGLVPWWLFRPERRVPGASPVAYLEALRLMTAPLGATVADRLDTAGPLYERLWRPLVEGVMNCTPEEADARLMGRVLRLTFGGGGRACRPLLAPEGLGPALVDPVLRHLAATGAAIRFGRRLRQIDATAGRVNRLHFSDGEEVLGPDDRVILALPAHGAAALLPQIGAPTGSRSIVNVHFRCDGAAWAPSFTGVVGTMAQWIFRRGDVLSVTISAAERYDHLSGDALAAAAYAEVVVTEGLRAAAGADGLPAGMPDPPEPPIDSSGKAPYEGIAAVHNGLPPFRVIKEKRATILQSPDEIGRRPGPATATSNLWLAGDWTDTGLPATIEGAVLSGRRAAEMAAA